MVALVEQGCELGPIRAHRAEQLASGGVQPQRPFVGRPGVGGARDAVRARVVPGPAALTGESGEVGVPLLVAFDKAGEVAWACEGGSFAVVASPAGGHEVVEAVVSAVAPWDEVLDFAMADKRAVAVKAGAVLEVEQSFGDALECDSIAAEEEVFELKYRASRLDTGVELCGLVGPPARDERRSSGPSEVSAAPTPGWSLRLRLPLR